MKVLLVIPPEESYIEASAHVIVDKKRESRPKLGILYIATYLNKHQPDVALKVLDCPSEDIDFAQYENIVKEFKPDLVGITAVTFTIVDALRSAQAVKKVFSETLVCIGGFQSTLFPRETLNQSGVDFVIFGEGEYTFEELVKELKKPDPEFEKILGLGFRKNNKLIINSPRPLIEDLDVLPFPNYHLVDIKKYAHVLGKNAVTISLQSSRGCPFACIFCDMRRTKYRYRSSENIVEEISYWYKEGISSFFMVDDNFVLNRNRLFDICSGIKNRNLKIEFKISARVDAVDREMLVALKSAGCSRINFGVESGHQKYLDYLEKGTTFLQTEKVFHHCHEVGIEAFAYMMIGIPDETREEMYQELNFLKKIKADYASFSVCSPYPKTELYKKLLKDRIIKRDYWQDFAENVTSEFTMPLIQRPYSSEELRIIQADLTRRFYLSGSIILKRLKNIRSLKQFLRVSILGLRILRFSKTQ